MSRADGSTSLVLLAFALGCGASPSPAPVVTSPSRVEAGPACAGASLLPASADLAARGPWPVGARTVSLEGMTTEIWYPAAPGSDRGAAQIRYDLREVMPASEAAKIPDADAVFLPCECSRDLPVDTAHGPYPVVVFLHGAASFRTQSTFLATHWASRGFVVVAPDLPGVGLNAALGGERQSAPLGAVAQIVDALAAAPDGGDPLAFVRPNIGRGRALVGHSLGSMMAATVVDRPEVEVRIAMAGLAVPDGKASWLVLTGDHDGIAYSAETATTFGDQPAPSRLGVIRGAGHLAFSDLCTLGRDRGGVLAIAKAHGVAVPEIVGQLAMDGCRDTDAPFATTAPVIRALTAGVLEEKLRCDAAAADALANLAKSAPITMVENR